jgi:hypothetical protein
MGEAKRRKQLGLMPEVENRDVILHRSGQVEGDAVPETVLERLSTWAETGERWDARYRTTFIGTGLPRELLNTDDELKAIPVPEKMRLRLGLLSGSAAWREKELESNPDAFFEENGQRLRQMNIRATEYEFAGQWAELPEFDSEEALRYLTQHPAVMAVPAGEDFAVTVWRGGEQDGKTSFDPQPDAAHADALSRAARELLGDSVDDSDEAWLEDHHSLLDDTLGEDNEAAPIARRVVLRLSSAPLVLSPAVQVLGRSSELDVSYAPGGEGYSQDGETWHDYPETKDRDAQLQALLEQMGLSDLSGLQDLLGQAAGEDGDGELLDERTIEAEVVENRAGPDDTDSTPSAAPRQDS